MGKLSPVVSPMSKNLVFILPPKEGAVLGPKVERRKLTHKRLSWLKILEIGPGHRNSNVGYWCMNAGWAEWNYVDAETGAPIDKIEAASRGFGDRVRTNGERLTQRGRWLAQWGVVGEVY